MKNTKFKILSIDGGGIKGVFPALFLTLLEDELKNRSDGKTKIYQHFDLITGTSTGGIIAIALALGIPAKEIYQLYLDNAKKIFGSKYLFSLVKSLIQHTKENFWKTLFVKSSKMQTMELNQGLAIAKQIFVFLSMI